MKELLKKLRRYEIKIRKAINNRMQGDFHSVFKGSGLEFDDVRAYQYGDDVRAIHWNVTAKGHGAYVKTFKEEKEQTVFFVLDVSASQSVGKPGKKKIDIAKEICGVLSLSALKEASGVGLFCFTDQTEKYVKPDKGPRHIYRILSSLYGLNPASKGTDVNKAVIFAQNTLKRKSVIIFISDFIDDNYEHNLKSLAFKHDLIMIHITDNRELKLPRLGIIPVYDREADKRIWINTSSPGFRRHIKQKFDETSEKLQDLSRRSKSTYMRIGTGEDYVPKLINLFKVRNKGGHAHV